MFGSSSKSGSASASMIASATPSARPLLLEEDLSLTHRLLSSSFLGLPYRTLNMNPKKELLWSLWVSLSPYTQKLKRLIAS